MLAPAASCSISLVFTPTASGQSSANLILADNAWGSPQTVPITATANPAFYRGSGFRQLDHRFRIRWSARAISASTRSGTGRHRHGFAELQWIASRRRLPGACQCFTRRRQGNLRGHGDHQRRRGIAAGSSALSPSPTNLASVRAALAGASSLRLLFPLTTPPSSPSSCSRFSSHLL